MFFELEPGIFTGFSFLFGKMNQNSEDLFLLLYK